MVHVHLLDTPLLLQNLLRMDAKVDLTMTAAEECNFFFTNNMSKMSEFFMDFHPFREMYSLPQCHDNAQNIVCKTARIGNS